MAMGFFIMVICIIVFGLTVVAGLILGVIGLSTDKPKMRNAGFITMGAGLILLVGTIFYSVNRTVTKVKDTFSGIGKSLDSLSTATGPVYNDVFEDDRSYLLNSATPNAQIEKIKSYIPDEREAGISPSFFTYFGSRDAFRYPLVYPYSIHCIDVKDFGTLVDESRVVDVKSNNSGEEENILFGVTHFNYDDKMLLLQTTSKLSPSDEKEKISYYIYDYATKKLTEFDTEAALLKKAGKLNYKGDKKLISISDYDYLF